MGLDNINKFNANEVFGMDNHHQTVNLRSEGALTMGRAPGAEVIPLRG